MGDHSNFVPSFSTRTKIPVEQFASLFNGYSIKPKCNFAKIVIFNDASDTGFGGFSSQIQDCWSYYIRSRPQRDIQEKTVCIYWLLCLRHDGSQDRVQLLNTYCIYLSIYIYLQLYLFLLRVVELKFDMILPFITRFYIMCGSLSRIPGWPSCFSKGS